jgi:hypothetical protein
MTVGLLASKESVHIRLGVNREIVSADDLVFEEQHQEESRTMIHESEYLSDYLEEFTSALSMGRPEFVTVTELGRQTTFRYEADGGQAIVLTRAHRGVDQALAAVSK